MHQRGVAPEENEGVATVKAGEVIAPGEARRRNTDVGADE